MSRTLIVARMRPEDAEAVGGLFAESDATELPHLIGVRRRTLFHFHELYFHLIESGEQITEPLYRNRSHPLFQDVNTKLAAYMRPYHPSWREPKDSMATPFYSWTAD
ncbi:TcmI family type II polyketide cyclase [Micromonospora sp. CPCC 206061]|uniref:TcmI family type II polyketide cyclase n=1 Tax=Micromonospora sp. CPCC 206061 TaxID=3122410 RepID=UPI002238759C|nr:TcmI family type II polyketide cyclase [Micromonospora sp. CPCC 205371]